jgi:NitT/TauT family transport system substrate-binding protein
MLVLAITATMVIGISGCSADEVSPEATGSVETRPASLPLKVGTLATDDLLPLWVAQAQGYLTEAGLDVEIITFQSPMESRAAMTAGEIDALMTDMVVAAQLTASEGARAVTVMQTAPAGVLANPESMMVSLEELSGQPIGISSPTVMEFIAEKALLDAGVAPNQIVFESIEKLPVRLEMLMSNQIAGAVLPWTLFQLAEQQGARPLLDHDAAAGYTSTVLVFSQAFLSRSGADLTVEELLKAWDRGVVAINTDPDAFRALLIDKANLPEPLRENYRIRSYPSTHIPSQEQFDEIVDWMVEKGYLADSIDFIDIVYQP